MQESYQHFNTAKLAFDKGDLKKTIDLLAQVTYNEVLLNIAAKVILLKIYYQEEDYDTLEALLDSFRVFLNRKKEITASKENYINLIVLVKKLLSLSLEKGAVSALKKEIEDTEQLAERKWLLEQI